MASRSISSAAASRASATSHPGSMNSSSILEQGLAVAHLRSTMLDTAGLTGALDDVLHLHRLEHQHRLPGMHQVALAHVDRHHRTRASGRGQRHRSRRVGPTARRSRPACACETPACASAKTARGARRGPRAINLADVLVDEARVHLLGQHRRMLHQAVQQHLVGGHADDAEFAQRAVGLGQQQPEVGGRHMHDQLGQQRVVVHAGRVAGVAEAVHAHAGAGRRLVARQHATRRPRLPVLEHRLHVDAQLHGDALRSRHLGLLETQRVQRGAVGNAQLRLHQVDARDRLGHGVLDLQPRIGLDEGETRAVVGVDQELEGADAAIAHGRGQAHRRLRQPLAHMRCQQRTRRELDHLLVAPLQRAFALPQVARPRRCRHRSPGSRYGARRDRPAARQ